jgi:heme exporter protein CcmD
MEALSALLGRHGGFILASYVFTVAIMGGLVWQSVRRFADVRRRHAETGERDHG